MSKSSIAERLAFFAKNLEYEDLPKTVVEQAKRCLLDTIGVILAGYKTDTGKIFTSLLQGNGVESRMRQYLEMESWSSTPMQR